MAFFKVGIVAKAKATLFGLRKAKMLLARETDKVLNQFGNRLVATAKSKYLTGPRPMHLGVVSGNLRSRIVARIQKLGNITQLLFGTDVKPYPAIHEFGKRIPAHIRIIKQAFGRQLRFPVAVHVRSFKMPKRAFLSPSLKDNRAWLRTNMLAAIKRAAQGVA